MQRLVTFLILVTIQWTPLSALSKNQCSCQPLPESKTYQGPARKKKLVGYTIDWSCDFRCKKDMRDPNSDSDMKVTAFYREYFMNEDGNEGICEGVVYRMQYNNYLGKEVYSPTNEIRGITPNSSKSPQLKKWSADNNCE